jgi:hypothetical protein
MRAEYLLISFTAKGGKVPDPAGAAPKRVELAVRTNVVGSKTIKIRHGPYKVPNMGSKNILNEEGTLWNYGDSDVEKPCDECTVCTPSLPRGARGLPPVFFDPDYRIQCWARIRRRNECQYRHWHVVASCKIDATCWKLKEQLLSFSRWFLSTRAQAVRMLPV